MNWFHLNLRKLMWMGLALLLPLLSLNVQRKTFESNWYDQPFQLLAGGVQNIFFNFSDGIRGTTSEYLNLIAIKRENQSLKKANAELLARLQLFDELEKENTRLLGLLDFKGKSKMSLEAAQVIGRDLLADHSTIRINKGTHHGLQSGQAVLTTEGVVGYIYRPEAFTSQVLLITDRYAVVDGIVSRTRARGIVEGKSPTTAALRYIERLDDVKAGDIVVTSGLDNIFPKGFPVAVVDHVESKSSAISLRVDLRPIVDPDKLEEVFVILNAAEEDYTSRFPVANALISPEGKEVTAKPPGDVPAKPAGETESHPHPSPEKVKPR